MLYIRFTIMHQHLCLDIPGSCPMTVYSCLSLYLWQVLAKKGTSKQNSKCKQLLIMTKHVRQFTG